MTNCCPECGVDINKAGRIGCVAHSIAQDMSIKATQRDSLTGKEFAVRICPRCRDRQLANDQLYCHECFSDFVKPDGVVPMEASGHPCPVCGKTIGKVQRCCTGCIDEFVVKNAIHVGVDKASDMTDSIGYMAMAIGGTKHDTGKLPWHLLPPDALEEITKVLEFGANKYSERNWEKGMNWSRCFGALMRHMWAWWRGENTDPETGISHLAHAGCCILFLLAYESRKVGTDDRFKINN